MTPCVWIWKIYLQIKKLKVYWKQVLWLEWSSNPMYLTWCGSTYTVIVCEWMVWKWKFLKKYTFVAFKIEIWVVLKFVLKIHIMDNDFIWIGYGETEKQKYHTILRKYHKNHRCRFRVNSIMIFERVSRSKGFNLFFEVWSPLVKLSKFLLWVLIFTELVMKDSTIIKYFKSST